jgi:hypothetical protein
MTPKPVSLCTGRVLLATSLLVTLTSFGSQAQSSPSPTALSASAGPLASCSRPSPIDRAPGLGTPEVIGRGTGARLWGAIMAPRFPLVASSDVVKIVWRMTGRGPLKLFAYDARGQSVPLAWGPDAHGTSNYARPGNEWGAGYRFRHSGCYRLAAQRTQGSAEVWLRVNGAA